MENVKEEYNENKKLYMDMQSFQSNIYKELVI